MKQYYERLRYLAASKKLEQVDLAKAIDQDPATINKWWNGDRVPGPKNTRVLCKLFNCEYEWLKNGKGDPPALEIVQSLQFDPDILTDAIIVLEEKLDQYDLEMRPEKKAELITKIYIIISEDEKGDAKERLAELLQIIFKK